LIGEKDTIKVNYIENENLVLDRGAVIWHI